MRKQRGFGTAELLVAIGIMAFTLFGTLALLIDGLKSYTKTTADVNNDLPTWQTIRRVYENLKAASSATITNSGNTITFIVPKLSGTVDPVTGEKEYVVPLVSDGLTHSYNVTGGNLVEQPSGRTLLKGISATDLDPTSSTYNKAYAPFTLRSIGSRQAITVTFVTSTVADRTVRYSRQKTTVVMQNIR